MSSVLGLTAADLMAAQAGRPKAQRCVVIFLWGGPGQQDLWDLKPQAPAELRGEFKPSNTNVTGISISEELPRLAQQADKYTIIRSMSHRDFEHGSAAYTALTGQPHPQPGTNTPASPDDFPTYGAVVSKLAPTSQAVPDAIVLGPVMHQGNRPPLAGQNAGFLGAGFDPFRIADDPGAADFRVEGLATESAEAAARLNQRRQLLGRLEQRQQARSDQTLGMHELYRRAFELLLSSQTQQAFDLSHESPALRKRYGPSRFGQSLLLARRLIEADVPLVTVNWAKLNADQWDTHKANYPRLRESCSPRSIKGWPPSWQIWTTEGCWTQHWWSAWANSGEPPPSTKMAAAIIGQTATRWCWPAAASLAAECLEVRTARRPTLPATPSLPGTWPPRCTTS